jgi:hypothetical protein
VPEEEGWSPYAAKQFLGSEGFETDDYHREFDNQWRSTSRSVKVRSGVPAPTLVYYVQGNDRAATELALELDVPNCDDAAAADERFDRAAATLISHAASPEKVRRLAQEMGDGETADLRMGRLRLRLSKVDRQAEADAGYERALVMNVDGAAESDSASD